MFVALLINGAYATHFRVDDLQFVLIPANCGAHLQRARGQRLHLGAPRIRRERETHSCSLRRNDPPLALV